MTIYPMYIREKLAHGKNIPTILNPAPAQFLSDELLRHVSIITPNETETELLTGIKVDSESSARKAADILLSKGIQNKGDTIQLTLSGTIKEVCAKKGCWMTLTMPDESDLMVRFKDYSFFVPLDAQGEVLINGKAFISETSVEDLRHYAEDAGASTEEIELITTPKVSYNFEADGVLILQ